MVVFWFPWLSEIESSYSRLKNVHQAEACFYCSFFLGKYGDQWPFPPNKLIQISRSLDPRSAADAQSTLQALGWKFPAPMAMAPNHLHTGKLLGLKQQKMVHLCHKQ
jgi:hypothetical protein